MIDIFLENIRCLNTIRICFDCNLTKSVQDEVEATFFFPIRIEIYEYSFLKTAHFECGIFISYLNLNKPYFYFGIGLLTCKI